MATNIQTLAAAIATLKRFDEGTALPHANTEHMRTVGDAWRDLRDAIMCDAPSGSGIDCGTTLCEDKCTPTRLVLACSFHHMNDVGMYSGWTEHTITITPTFDGIDVRIGGRDRNGIKEYLHDVYSAWARSECPHVFTMPAPVAA